MRHSIPKPSSRVFDSMLLRITDELSSERGSPIRGRYGFENVVLQPSRTCNLNCDYCYLPQRRSAAKMPVSLAAALAKSISAVPQSVPVTWHGGEHEAWDKGWVNGADRINGTVSANVRLLLASLLVNVRRQIRVWAGPRRGVGRA